VGKSTLLSTISGLIRPVRGAINFKNKKISGMDPDKVVRLGISQTPEGRRVFPDLSVEDNLMAGAYTRKGQEVKKDLEMYCQRFPILGKRRNQKAGLLSGGEQQMLAIARSLMSRPTLLLLDEPSLGLAPVVISEVYSIIEEIKREGTTILLVEQNAKKALSVADRAYVMTNGKITLSGTGKELANDDSVRKAYLGI
jgi:branched-chain amino acid transport system ATP-binding protein